MGLNILFTDLSTRTVEISNRPHSEPRLAVQTFLCSTHPTGLFLISSRQGQGDYGTGPLSVI
jgi:hypothetical protein